MYVDRIIPDPVHDKLIFSNKFIRYIDNKYVRGIWSWNGVKWDSLSKGINGLDVQNTSANGTALCGIEYNGKLLVGGIFQSMGRSKTTSLALWDGIKWDSLPNRAFRRNADVAVYGFLKANNLLYIHGCFDTIAGQKAQSLATYDGASFTPIILPLDWNCNFITCMMRYKNEFYIGGNFGTSANTTNYDILKSSGSSWVNVGGGIQGSTSSISSMEVYNDELYVAGYFEKQSGNVGNVIMKWDGTNWHDVGWGDMIFNASVWKLLVHQNKLFAFGTFNYAADEKASKVAVFDGSKWCMYADSLDGTIYSAAVYHDTLFIAGGFKTISGDTDKKLIAKLINVDNYTNCKSVGFTEIDADNGLLIYPNPVQDILTVELHNSEVSTSKITFYNVLGQKIADVDQPKSKNEIDISALFPGIYLLRVENRLGQRVYKVLKE